MTFDDLRSRQVSRRELLRVAGIGGVSAAALGIAGGLARPLLAGATQLDDTLPEGFLATAFAGRARAMSTGDGAGLDALYDPANGTLIRHEKARAAYYKRGINDLWGGGTILDYVSAPELIDLKVAGGTATARVYDRVAVRWVPQPRIISPDYEQAKRADPGRFREPEKGSQGEITSRFATRHDLTLVKGPSGWRLAKDSYDEWLFFGPSPDLIKGSWSEEPKGGGPTGLPAPVASEPQLAAMAYNRSLAVQCAGSNWSTYNYQYCNYNACGGDCTNFISQCLRAGGHSPYGDWKTNNNGGCGTCGTSATYAGTDTWANNMYLRDYLNNSGRGTPMPNQYQLGIGDIINYDWASSAGGPTDHITLVIATSAGGPYIAGHNPDMYNVFWSFGSINYATYSRVS